VAVDEQAVAALVGEVERAWNTHDMHRFAACFAPDADFVNVMGIWSWVIRDRHGRLEIVSSHNTDTKEVPPAHPLADP